MPRTLLKNGYIVTVDGARAVHLGGFVAIDDARISAVGPFGATPDASNFDDVVDLSGCIVLPGLINGHQHHWYTLFKGLAEDRKSTRLNSSHVEISYAVFCLKKKKKNKKLSYKYENITSKL